MPALENTGNISSLFHFGIPVGIADIKLQAMNKKYFPPPLSLAGSCATPLERGEVLDNLVKVLTCYNLIIMPVLYSCQGISLTNF